MYSHNTHTIHANTFTHAKNTHARTYVRVRDSNIIHSVCVPKYQFSWYCALKIFCCLHRWRHSIIFSTVRIPWNARIARQGRPARFGDHLGGRVRSWVLLVPFFPANNFLVHIHRLKVSAAEKFKERTPRVKAIRIVTVYGKPVLRGTIYFRELTRSTTRQRPFVFVFVFSCIRV